MPYLPLALALAESYMASGRVAWLALLALVLGIQWTLGHFQIQAWTNVLVILTGLWRWTVDRRLVETGARAHAATVWGAGARGRPARPELAIRRSRRPDEASRRASCSITVSRRSTGSTWSCRSSSGTCELGPDDPYWFAHQTEAYEVALYIGTIPLDSRLPGGFLAAGKPGDSALENRDPDQFRARHHDGVVA